MDFAEATVLCFALDSSRLHVVHSFLIMDTSLGITPYVHITGAKGVDSFIAQAKKLVALLDISKISTNNHK